MDDIIKLVVIGLIALVALVVVFVNRPSRPPKEEEDDYVPLPDIELLGIVVDQQQRYVNWDWEFGKIPELARQAPVISQGFPITFRIWAEEINDYVASTSWSAYRLQPNDGRVWNGDPNADKVLGPKAIMTNSHVFLAGGCNLQGDDAIFMYKVKGIVTLASGRTEMLEQFFYVVPATYFPTIRS